jgi:hypothetical protein
MTGEGGFRERNSLQEPPPRHLKCIAEGCLELRVSRGRCNRHYQAWYRENRADHKRQSDRRWRERTGYAARRRKPKRTRACAECGRLFETAVPHQRYHDRVCKKRAENRRARN